MPVLNFILHHWEQQQKIFIHTLLAIRSKPGKKTVHDWRVAVKKIRSYLRLREEISGEKWKEEFSGVKILFAILGKHRDADMSLSLLKQYNDNKNDFIFFRKQLHTALASTRLWVKDAVAAYDEKELSRLSLHVHSSLAIFSDAELEKIITTQVKKKLAATLPLMEEFDKHAHEIRKLLKDVYYWLKLLPGTATYSKPGMKLLEKTLEALGKWQDHFVFLKKLKQFRKEYLVKGTPEFPAAAAIEDKIHQKQKELLHTAREKLNKFMMAN